MLAFEHATRVVLSLWATGTLTLHASRNGAQMTNPLNKIPGFGDMSDTYVSHLFYKLSPEQLNRDELAKVARKRKPQINLTIFAIASRSNQRHRHHLGIPDHTNFSQMKTETLGSHVIP